MCWNLVQVQSMTLSQVTFNTLSGFVSVKIHTRSTNNKPIITIEPQSTYSGQYNDIELQIQHNVTWQEYASEFSSF